MIILGIESSCDDSSVAIVNSNKEILAHAIISQTKQHMPYGGVVPEIAARSHADALGPLLTNALNESGLTFDKIDAFAATAGPGLIGGVMVGAMAAKTLAAVYNKPFIAVNHLEGHALTVRLTHNVEFPYLLLLASGGHTQILNVEGVGKYNILGTTMDDAVGEAFDKTAKILGLGYPGGPQLEELAKSGNDGAFKLSQPLQKDKSCAFSFSGLKSATKRLWDSSENKDSQAKADIALCFQNTVTKFLGSRVRRAMKNTNAKTLVVAGGVAANKSIRNELEMAAAEYEFDFCAPPLELCTDNGAMIAWAGLERFRLGLTDGLDFKPRPRWPLDTMKISR